MDWDMVLGGPSWAGRFVGRTTVKRLVKSATAIVGLMSTVSAFAGSAEFCVSCAGPEAHYACTFDGAATDANDPRLKLLCITELAKAGGHATCSVDRTAVKPCAGVPKTLAMPEGFDLAPALPAQPAAIAPSQTPAPAPANGAPPVTAPAVKTETTVPKAEQPAAEVPPKTVKEMVEKSTTATGNALEKGADAAGNAVKSTGSALQKAGQAAGDAAKKTWNCITSFFGDC